MEGTHGRSLGCGGVGETSHHVRVWAHHMCSYESRNPDAKRSFYSHFSPRRRPEPSKNQNKVTVATTNCTYGSFHRRSHPPSADLRLLPATRLRPSSATRSTLTRSTFAGSRSCLSPRRLLLLLLLLLLRMRRPWWPFRTSSSRHWQAPSPPLRLPQMWL